MSSSSPIVIGSDSEAESPVKIVRSPRYRHAMKLLDAVGETSTARVKRELSYEDSEPDLEVEVPVSKKSKTSDAQVVAHLMAYESPPEKYSAETILKILLNPNIDKSKVCRKWPIEDIETSSTFVVDITELKHPDDVRKDYFGKWTHSGSHPVPFKATINEDGEVEVERCAPGASGDVFFLRRLHCYHPSNSNFRRLISFVSDNSHNPHSLCLVVYYVPLGFAPVISGHGNAKSNKPFFPTLPSTVQLIKSKCSATGPKEVVASVSSRAGGIVGATYPGELPRNEEQVSNFKKRRSSSVDSRISAEATLCSEANDLYTVMLQAHLEDTDKKFARSIKTYPEPAIVLASERQLNDVARFCCNSSEFCVLTVDPTFSLGDFDVTPTTYRHLLLTCNRSGKSPVMIGPILIHYKKTFQSYLFLASSMVGLKKDIGKLRAFGTDGERALIEAFSHEFRFAIHLTCFIHVRRNIKDELTRLMLPESLRNEILDDIFGRRSGSSLFEGLVDSIDLGSFEENLAGLMAKWKSDLEYQEQVGEFCEWFIKNKSDVVRQSMLRSVREEAGLGCPPEAFYTNASECINSVIKVKVQYKKSELPQFISKLCELCEEQEREVERAVLQRGKYRLKPNYRSMEVDESKWFRMTPEQRTQDLKKLNSLPVLDDLTSASFEGSGPSNSDPFGHSSSLADELSPLCDRLGLPITAIEAIAKKAMDIIAVDDGIVVAPGQPTARMVLSKTGRRPHLVMPKKKGGFACDDDCPQYKSSGLCSHIVAVAKHGNQVLDFVSSYRGLKRSPNMTKLAVSEMPKGRGRKGNRAPARRKKSMPVEARYEFDLGSFANDPDELSSDSSLVGTSHVRNSSVSGGASVSSVLHAPAANTVLNAPITGSVLGASSAASFPFYPPFPPPSFLSGSSNECYPYRLCFIAGNISICNGCKGKYRKELGPPHDLCIQHEEWRTFTPSGTTTPQSRFGNVYYHCNPPCILAINPMFVPSSVIISPNVYAKLSHIHVEWLSVHFQLF